MKRLCLKVVFLATFLVFTRLLSLPVYAKYGYELTPSISLSEEYDDNIYLTPVNQKSDYITAVTPGIHFNFLTQESSVQFRYAPTFVWYAKESENNFIGQLGTGTLAQKLSRNWTFNLTDTFLKSEDPLKDILDISGLRRTRNTYWNNDAKADFRYQFGPENFFSFGYHPRWYENNAPGLNDWKSQDLFSNVDYWLDTKNGLSFNYVYTRGDYSGNDFSTTQTDYTGFTAGLSYNHRFSPHTTSKIGYEFTKRDFERPLDLAPGLIFDQSYKVHQVTIGGEHAFSRTFSATLDAGYFIQEREVAGSESGPVYEVSLIKNFKQGSFNLRGRGGWYESYMDINATGGGLIRYYGVDATLGYQFLEELRSHVSGFYQVNEDALNAQWKTYRGNCGIQWAFLRWYTLSLDYTYAKSSGDIDLEGYTDNRIMLRLTLQKPYKWQD